MFELTPRQLDVRDNVLAKPGVHKLLYGGSRSTKTFLICYAISKRAWLAPNSRHVITRLHNIDVRHAIMMDTWPAVMRLVYPDLKRGRDWELKTADQVCVFSNEAEIWFAGLDDEERVDKVLGKEYSTIFANECSQIPYSSIIVLRSRLAQNVARQDGPPLALKGYYDLNPVGQLHWSFQEFVKHVQPANGMPLDDPADYQAAVMNPADNPLLPPEYRKILDAMPERQRKRFRDGQYITELPGALWSGETIERLRVAAAPDLTRVVVAVDPSGSDGTGGDSQGIVAVGKGVDGKAYVLEDRSCKQGPNGWGRRTVELYRDREADMIVAEINFGGAMVVSTIRTCDPNVPVKTANASRGKHIRAEPVSALYDQGKVHHVGRFPELEEQMGMMKAAGYEGVGSPDRLDALVWALTELMLDGEPGLIGYYRRQAEDMKNVAATVAQR